MIKTTLTGALPRQQALINKTRAYDRGRLSDEELQQSFRTGTIEAIEAQKDLSHVTDGNLRGQDLLRPFTRLEGVEAGPLLRWFDNNTFYRTPIIKGKLGHKTPVTEQYTDLLPTGAEWRAVLPAPYTFAKLSDNQHYGDFTSLMMDYAEALRKEISSLELAGFKQIQLSDPALVYRYTAPTDLEWLDDVLNQATKGTGARVTLHTFFGDASEVLKLQGSLDVDCIGLDLYASDVDKLSSVDCGVCLGVLDARNTFKEDPVQLSRIARDIAGRMGASDVTLAPNTSLDFLTWGHAMEKIRILEETRQEMEAKS